MNWIVASLSIIASLLLIGFFAGIEIAFVSANKLSIELRRKQGTYSGKIWGHYADQPTRFIGTTLIGFNVLLVVYGLCWSSMIAPLWDLHSIWWKKFNTDNPYIRLAIETILSAICLIVIEFFFKAIFRAKKDSVLNNGVITYVVQFFFMLFSGISTLLVEVATWMLKYIFNVSITEKKDAFSKVDLEHFLQQSKSNEEEDNTEINKELFENALSLSETRIRECLVPRKEIESITQSASIEEVKQKFIDTQLSKLVVYGDNIDNIVGYVHQLDLFKNPRQISDVLLPIPVVPESMSATDLMSKFTRERKSIAWVIDEFGGTAGIVTMEDLLEEIFGEIQDEHDTEELVDKQLSTNEYLLSGRVELDYLTEKYKLEFPDSEGTETLSGFIIQHRDAIPSLQESFTVGNFQFDILNVSDTRIETVKLKVLK